MRADESEEEFFADRRELHPRLAVEGSEPNRPYVAVTGLCSPGEVAELDIPEFPSHDVMLGVLVSKKSVEGKPASPRYPSLEGAAETFAAINALGRNDVVAACHYNTRPPYSSADFRKIAYACWKAGSKIGAMQFNASPHFAKWATQRLRLNGILHPLLGSKGEPYFWENTDFIYQVNGSSVRKFGGLQGVVSFFGGARWHGEYAYMLYDMSGGRGRRMDFAKASEARRLATAFPEFTFGVAGGLAPDSVATVFEQMGKGVSVDVESGVRNGEDALDAGLANAYLKAAAEALEKG